VSYKDQVPWSRAVSGVLIWGLGMLGTWAANGAQADLIGKERC
jgi:hypothetical protein